MMENLVSKFEEIIYMYCALLKDLSNAYLLFSSLNKCHVMRVNNLSFKLLPKDCAFTDISPSSRVKRQEYTNPPPP